MKFAKNLQEWPKCPCRLWFIMQHNIIYLSLYILYANLVPSFRWSSMENRCNHQVAIWLCAGFYMMHIMEKFNLK